MVLLVALALSYVTCISKAKRPNFGSPVYGAGTLNSKPWTPKPEASEGLCVMFAAEVWWVDLGSWVRMDNETQASRVCACVCVSV